MTKFLRKKWTRIFDLGLQKSLSPFRPNFCHQSYCKCWANKFEVDILKNVAKIANLRPKIGQIPLLSLDIIGHNSINFYPILTFFIFNCLFSRDESNGVQIKALSLLVNILVFGPIFAPRLHTGKIVRMDPKPP